MLRQAIRLHLKDQAHTGQDRVTQFLRGAAWRDQVPAIAELLADHTAAEAAAAHSPQDPLPEVAAVAVPHLVVEAAVVLHQEEGNLKQYNSSFQVHSK